MPERRAQSAQCAHKDVRGILRAIKDFHNQGKEAHVSEVVEKVGMETRPTGIMLNARGLQARTTRREENSCRYFTFDLCEKGRAMREEAKDR